jgi:hypothetical protein
MFIRFLIFFIIIVLVELYFLQAIKTISIDYTPHKRKILLWVVYGLAACSILLAGVSLVVPPPNWPAVFRFISSMFLILFLCKFIGVLFLLMLLKAQEKE